VRGLLRRWQPGGGVLNTRYWTVLVFAWIAVASAARAQEVAFSPPAPPADGQLAQIDLGAEATYDSNVVHSDAADAAARGLSLADEVFYPNASINIDRPFGRETFFLDGSIGYVFYDHDTLLNRERIDVTGGGAGSVGPCQTTLIGDYSRRQSDLTDIPVNIVQNVEDWETVGLQSECVRTIGFGPALQVSETWEQNSAAQLVAADHQTFTATPSIAYNQPTIGKISLFGSYTDGAFPNRVENGTEDGYHMYSGGLRYQRRIGARLDGSISVGYAQLDPQFAGVPHFRGVTYQADFTYLATSRLLFHLSLDRAPRPSLLYGATYDVNGAYDLDATYKLSQRISLTLGGTAQRRRVEGQGLNPVIENTSDTILGGFGSASVQFRRFTLSLEYRHQHSDANVPEFTYSENRVGLSLHVPIRL